MTIVLIAGAWHGGWCWARVVPLLEADGERVVAPSLTGLGDRAHLLSPSVNLDTHIQDVENLLFYEDLHDVVLVGHSYGGMVVSGVADRARHRVRGIIYLDCTVPESGQSLMDTLPPRRTAFFRDLVAREGDGWRLPRTTAAVMGITDPADAAWADARLTDHPFAANEQQLHLANDPPPRAYIACTATRSSATPHAEAARARGWPYAEIATGHDAMITAPADLVAAIVDLSRAMHRLQSA